MAINFAPGTLSRNIPGFDPTAAWTVAWWVRPHTDTPPTGQYRQYYTHGGLAGTNWIWTGSYESSFGGNSVGFEAGDNDEFYDSTIVSLPLGVWAHLAVTYNPTTHDALLYKDHTLVGSLNFDLSSLDDTWSGHDEWFAGQWGNMEGAYLRLWQATLSASEITAEAAAQRAVRTTNLLADTPLYTASDVADYSGHGNHWTLTGTCNTVPGPLPTQITRVQGSGKQHGASATVVSWTLPAAPVLGNSIVIELSNWGNTNFPTWNCVDSYGNSYRHAGGTASGSISASIWYCPKISSTGPGFTVTLTAPSSCYFAGSVVELHAPAGLAIDQIALLTGSGVAPNATLPLLLGSDTVLAAVWSGSASQSSSTVASVSPAWTQEYEELDASTYEGGEGDTRILGPATGTAPSVSWALSNSTTWAVVLVAFKPNITADFQRGDSITVTERVIAGFLPPIVVKADAVTVSESVTALRAQKATVLTQPNWAAGFVFSGTGFFPPMGWSNLQLVSEANAPFRMDQGGTIRRLAVLQELPAGAGTSRTFTFRKNGVNQALTVTLGATETYKADETHSFTVAAGDIVVIGVTVTGAPANGRFSLVWDFEPTANVAHYAIGGNVQNVQNNGPHWLSPFSGGGWSSTAVNSDTLVAVSGTITQYRMTLSNAPGAGRLRTIVWVKNGVMQDGTGGTPDTTIIIAGTAKDGATLCALTVAEGDRVSVRMIGTGSPTSTYFTGSHSFMPFAPHEIPLAGACSANSAQSNTTSYAPAFGDCTFSVVPELPSALPAPLIDLTLRRMRLMVEVALVAGAHVHDYTLRRNLAATPQTLTIGPLVTDVGPAAGADVTYHFGDVLTVEAVTGGTLSNVRPHWAFAAESLIAGSLSVSVRDTVTVTEIPALKIRPTKLLVPVRIDGISIADDLEVRQQSAHLLTAIVRDTVTVREDTASPGPPFGITRVQATPRVQTASGTTISVTFPKPPTVGNAIVLMVGGFATLADPGTGSDTRGNPYDRGPAASNIDTGSMARVFYAPSVRASGTPFTVMATFLTSNPRWAVAVEVQTGGWGLLLDQSAASPLQIVVSPPTPVTTGATPPLTAADEFLAALFSVAGTTYQYNVVTPATPVWRQETEGLVTDGAGEANTRIVTGALGTTPSCAWQIGTTGVWPAAVIAAFKTGSALIMLSGTTISLRLAETIVTRDDPALLRRPVPMNITVAEFITAREAREEPLPTRSTTQVITPQGVILFDPGPGDPTPRTSITYEAGPWPSGEFTICFWLQKWGEWWLDADDYIAVEAVDYTFGPMLRCSSGGFRMEMPTDYQWHHITVLSRTTGVTIALDRQQVTIPAPTPGPYNWEDFSANSGFQSSGRMPVAYYRVWDAILTPAELQQERGARRAVRTANLWRDTPLEEASLLDVSGNNRHWITGSSGAGPAPVANYGEPLPWVAEAVRVFDVAVVAVLAPHQRFAVEVVRVTDDARAMSPLSRIPQEAVTVREVLAVAPFDPRTAKQVRWYTTRLEPTYYPPTRRGSWDVVGVVVSGGSGGAAGNLLKLVHTPMPTYDQFWVYNQYGISTLAGAAGSTGYCMTTISEPLPAQVIAGFVNLCHYLRSDKGFAGSGGTPNGPLGVGFCLYIYVTIGETDGVRGVLLDYTSPASGNVWPRSSSRWWQLDADALLSPVALQPGDRVVIEWGFIARVAYLNDSTFIGYYATTQDRRDDGVPQPIGVLGQDAPKTYAYSGYIDFQSGILVTPIIARPRETITVASPTFRSGPGPLNRPVFDAVTVNTVALGTLAIPTGHSGTDTLTVTEGVTRFLQPTRSVNVHDSVSVTSVPTLSDIGGPPPPVEPPSLPIVVFERVRVIENRLRSVETSKLLVRAYDYVTTIEAKTPAIYGTVWDGGGTPPAPTTSTSGDYWLVGI